MVFWFFLLPAVGLASGFSSSSNSSSGPKEPLARARWLMKNHLTIDGHNDLPWQYRKKAQNHVQPSLIDLRKEQPELGLHTDIPKLREGQLTGQFWSVYVDCTRNDKDGVRSTLEQIESVLAFCFCFCSSALAGEKGIPSDNCIPTPHLNILDEPLGFTAVEFFLPSFSTSVLNPFSILPCPQCDGAHH